MNLAKLVSGLALTVALATPLSAQTVVGSVDWVDRDSIAGWACYQGDPNTNARVFLFLYNTATSQWTSLGDQWADKARTDVGGSGLCGYGIAAYYHGFEYTIFPEQTIASQGSYQIYALVDNTFLPGNSGPISFAQTGFPTGNVWRTDYEDPTQKIVAMVSCIWPFKGANPVPGVNGDEDPLFLNAGATIKETYWESAPGVFSGKEFCLRNDFHNSAYWPWNQSNSATNSPTWPTSNYWVISVNNELAYSKIQSGPPSQSQPVNTSGFYTISAEKQSFYLGLDNSKAGYHPGDYPFLSFGASMGRGVNGPLGFIQPTGQDTHLEFTVQQMSETAGSDYHDIAVYIEMMWGGYKRFLGVSLRQQGLTARYHWNWNALESFWFPGGEFNILSSNTLNTSCAFLGPYSQMPVLTTATVGQIKQVSIPLRGILNCLDYYWFPNPNYGGTLGWEVARPTNLPIAITGVQLAVEQGPGQPNSAMKTRFTKPVLVNH